MDSDSDRLKIVRVLLQDASFLKHWRQISDALQIPSKEFYAMDHRFSTGDVQMYDVTKWMLEAWRCKDGKDATPQTLMNILTKEGFRNATDLLQAHLVQQQPEHQTRPVLPQISVSKSMQERNLEIIERIDAGAFSEVLKAKGTFDNVHYAIKKISFGKFMKMTMLTNPSEAATNRLQYFDKLVREVRAMANLQKSPHVVTYLDAWFEGPLEDKFQQLLRVNPLTPPPISPTDGTKGTSKPTEDEISTFFCIKMELCDTNLDKWIETLPQSRDVKTAECIVKQILEGLAHTHSQGYIHRDLKPKNILMDISRVGNNLIIKIGDFGLAREVRESDTALSAVQVPVRDFQSPEMLRGDHYDKKTDIYSVGLIYLNLLLPFASVKEQESVFMSIRRGDAEKYTDKLQNQYQRDFKLLRRMLERRSEKRPEAHEALDELCALMGLSGNPDAMEVEYTVRSFQIT